MVDKVIEHKEFFLKEDEGTYLIVKYVGKDKVLFIPEMYNDLPITSISDHVFDTKHSVRIIISNSSIVNFSSNSFVYNEQIIIYTPLSQLNIVSNQMKFTVNYNLQEIISVLGVKYALFNHEVPYGTAFDYTSELGTSLVLETSINQIPIKLIDDFAFYGSDLETVVIPNSYTSLGISSFGYCRTLEKIKLSDSITIIMDAAFHKNRLLEEVTLPKKMELLSRGIFLGCSNLKKVTLPENLKVIGKEAFFGCGIRYISLPDSVEHIKEYAFANNEGLAPIYVKQIDKIRFDKDIFDDEQSINILTTNFDQYSNLSLQDLKDNVKIYPGIDEIVIIDNIVYAVVSAYDLAAVISYENTDLKDINIVENINGLKVKKILRKSFYEAPIESVKINSQLNIDEKAFHNSYMLKHIISSHEFSFKKSSFDGTKINVSELKGTLT